MRSLLSLILVVLVFLPGCGDKGDKVPEQLFGKWVQETAESKKASPEARLLDLTYEIKPDGTVVKSCGPMKETKSYLVKDGKLIIKDEVPQPIQEMTADRLVLGDGANQMIFTRLVH